MADDERITKAEEIGPSTITAPSIEDKSPERRAIDEYKMPTASMSEATSDRANRESHLSNSVIPPPRSKVTPAKTEVDPFVVFSWRTADLKYLLSLSSSEASRFPNFGSLMNADTLASKGPEDNAVAYDVVFAEAPKIISSKKQLRLQLVTLVEFKYAASNKKLFVLKIATESDVCSVVQSDDACDIFVSLPVSMVSVKEDCLRSDGSAEAIRHHLQAASQKLLLEEPKDIQKFLKHFATWPDNLLPTQCETVYDNSGRIARTQQLCRIHVDRSVKFGQVPFHERVWAKRKLKQTFQYDVLRRLASSKK